MCDGILLIWVDEEAEEELEEEEEEEEEDLAYNVEYVEDLEESDVEAEVEDTAEDLTALYERVAAHRAQRLKRKAEGAARRSARVEVEYETEEPAQKKETAW